MGGSYDGYTQLASAVRGNKHLIAMSAWVTTEEVCNNWIFTDGALFMGFAVPWGAFVMNGRQTEDSAPYRNAAFWQHLPLASIDSAGGWHSSAFRELLRHPRCNDAFWHDMSLEHGIEDIQVPMLVVTGWYDLFLKGALQDHVAISTRARSDRACANKRLIIGPWAHTVGVRTNTPAGRLPAPKRDIDFGSQAQVNVRDIDLRWFDYWLKGIDNGVEAEAPIRIFVMGENYWRDEQEWPLRRTRYTKFYIGSAGKANGAAGDGTLNRELRSAAETDTFVYDPASPVPTLSASPCCTVVPFGPWDQSEASAREDVLVYASAPLKEPLEVTGPIVMKLFAASSAPDTDWVVKLVDLHADGYAQNLQEGIVRARYRNGTHAPPSLLEAGRIYEYTIDLWATSNTFLPGHRIRVEITSSSFPRFDRNLNTGEDPFNSARMQKARQTIYHSAQYPSHVVLPIIERAEETASPQSHPN